MQTLFDYVVAWQVMNVKKKKRVFENGHRYHFNSIRENVFFGMISQPQITDLSTKKVQRKNRCRGVLKKCTLYDMHITQLKLDLIGLK